MEKVVRESKMGLYNIYYTPEGTRLIVLNGLRAEDAYTPSPLQTFVHGHYTTISSLYWVIFAVTLIYMLGIYIINPLLKRYSLY